MDDVMKKSLSVSEEAFEGLAEDIYDLSSSWDEVINRYDKANDEIKESMDFMMRYFTGMNVKEVCERLIEFDKEWGYDKDSEESLKAVYEYDKDIECLYIASKDYYDKNGCFDDVGIFDHDEELDDVVTKVLGDQDLESCWELPLAEAQKAIKELMSLGVEIENIGDDLEIDSSFQKPEADKNLAKSRGMSLPEAYFRVRPEIVTCNAGEFHTHKNYNMLEEGIDASVFSKYNPKRDDVIRCGAIPNVIGAIERGDISICRNGDEILLKFNDGFESHISKDEATINDYHYDYETDGIVRCATTMFLQITKGDTEIDDLLKKAVNGSRYDVYKLCDRIWFDEAETRRKSFVFNGFPNKEAYEEYHEIDYSEFKDVSQEYLNSPEIEEDYEL